jgi:2,4-dienoyl-CoA reductase-like NADH-dependent reductase (Old Yellow Enzyme family)
MAPPTGSRVQADSTPSHLAAQYYAQRASAGIVITEATAVSQSANGAYLNTRSTALPAVRPTPNCCHRTSASWRPGESAWSLSGGKG